MLYPSTEFDTEDDVQFFDDVDLPHESEQSYLDVNLTEASVYLELAMDECDDGEISQDIMRSYRSLITALTKAQERRDDGSE